MKIVNQLFANKVEEFKQIIKKTMYHHALKGGGLTQALVFRMLRN